MSTQAHRATLDVVAATAGVSRMTVSNAYNRPEVVAVGTRERVLAAAAQVGYGGPSPVGRTLRRGTTDVLGLLLRVGLPDAFADPASAQFLRGIARGCDEADLSLQIVHATGLAAARRQERRTPAPCAPLGPRGALRGNCPLQHERNRIAPAAG